jgi:hypothetical protein
MMTYSMFTTEPFTFPHLRLVAGVSEGDQQRERRDRDDQKQHIRHAVPTFFTSANHFRLPDPRHLCGMLVQLSPRRGWLM